MKFGIDSRFHQDAKNFVSTCSSAKCKFRLDYPLKLNQYILFFWFPFLQTKKKKGISHLIETANPNRSHNKMKKARDLDVNSATPTTQQLSRRERYSSFTDRAHLLLCNSNTQELVNICARLWFTQQFRFHSTGLPHIFATYY